MLKAAATALSCLVLAGSAMAQDRLPCGNDFGEWKAGLRAEAEAAGIGAAGLAALDGATRDPDVIKRDRSQGVFTLDFLTFSKRLISKDRMDRGKANLQKYSDVFARAASQYGIAPEVITAFWAFETDYGQVQGDFVTINALATLAHDCRRPDLFRPELLAMLELVDKGIVPADVTGAWAGEIGQIQVLPHDYLNLGTDGDGDGKVSMKTSPEDAIMTAGNFLKSLGWAQGQPWLQEVTVPQQMEWFDSGLHMQLPVEEWEARGVRARNGATVKGLQASLVLPMGRRGPAFLAYPNFRVLLEWNQSLTYVLTAAYFATRLQGAPVYIEGENHGGLEPGRLKVLQGKLQSRGYDVGKIDGVLGAGTRDAVRREQKRVGLPADGWPTEILFSYL